MPFDFKATYASYTDEQLAQIAASENGYQPAAVAAAKALLEERGITGENLQDMLFSGQPETMASTDMPQYEDGKTTIFEDVERRPVSGQTKKNLVPLYIVFSALFVYCLSQSLLRIYSSYTPYTQKFITVIFNLWPLALIYMLYQRQKWGWLLSAGYLSYLAVMALPAALSVLTEKLSTHQSLVVWIIPLIALPAYIFCLSNMMRPYFRADFTISGHVMWRPVVIGAALAIGMYAINWL